MKLIVTSVLFMLAAAVPVYFLWNWLMPELFHLPAVTFWQALGLSSLSTALFKSPAATVKK